MAVQYDPLSRKFQEKFVFLKSELETILSTLEDQQRVLVALDDSIGSGEAKSVSVDTIKHLGRELSVVEFSLHSTEETLQNFGEMARRTADLESWVRIHSLFICDKSGNILLTDAQHFRMVESNKDRQEKAALAFTTVTVLFLPVTLLASIFGMNTNDIRNMNQGQWLFWVIATPLCIVGMVIWLAYLGSLSRWWREIKRMGRHRDTSFL
jgi:Mg2+ and Co2+ transporter CorA